MTPKQQLDAIVRGKVSAAVREHLGGDWSRLPSLFTIPRALFDDWADSVELPCGRVAKVKSPQDGIYVLRDRDGWLVFEQERGVHRPGERVYASYKEAKRAALALDLLSVLRGAV
jgi:hypothetical protein